MRVMLIDDEPLALELLEIQLKKVCKISNLQKFTYLNIHKQARLIQETDVVFLDIEMPGNNGLELAEQIVEINPQLEIVFVTAFHQYAVEAFELQALDYLIKPVQVERLKKTVERLPTYINKHTSPTTKPSHFRVNISGELSFEGENNTYEIIKWRTAKSKELFLYLLQHTGKTVRKSKLVDLLWPDFEPNRAYSQLYTTIYNIRKTLGKYHEHFLIKSMHSSYSLIIKNVSIDITEWENRLKAAPPLYFDTIQKYEEMMAIYGECYLSDEGYLWAEPERFRLEKLWLKHAHQIANFYEQQRDVEKAIQWYTNICNRHPDDEIAHFALMKIYAELGYGIFVHHQYEKLQEALQELDIEISEHIQRWYTSWRGVII
ncbi:response regulator [Virgibacillus soli]